MKRKVADKVNRRREYKIIGSYGDSKTGEPYNLEQCIHTGKMRKHYIQRGARSFVYI